MPTFSSPSDAQLASNALFEILTDPTVDVGARIVAGVALSERLDHGGPSPEGWKEVAGRRTTGLGWTYTSALNLVDDMVTAMQIGYGPMADREDFHADGFF